MHDACGYQEIDQRGEQQQKEAVELHQAFLPDHQCGDVAKRREGSSRIGCDNDIDAANADKPFVVLAHGEQYGAHHQCGGQVVQHRREKKRQHAGKPEQLPVAELLAHQKCAQGFEYKSFIHGVDIGHGGQQEQE